MIRRSLNALRAQLRFTPEAEASDSTAARLSAAGLEDGSALPRLPHAARERLARLDIQLYAARLDDHDRGVRGNRPLAQALAEAARQDSRASDVPASREPGRLQLFRRLQEAVADTFCQHGQLALMFIDLQGFELPDGRGSARGPGTNLLSIVATRADDEETGCGVAASLTGITETIRGRIEGRYCIDGRHVEIGATVGIALMPLSCQRREALLGCTCAAGEPAEAVSQSAGRKQRASAASAA